MTDQKFLLVSDIHHSPPESDLRLDRLCGVPGKTGEDLHRHLFEAGGDLNAINALKEIWPTGAIGIGFSAAGTLLWRAALAGLPLGGLICVSSTRLRLETRAPDVPRLAIWGACDPGIPNEAWQDRSLSDGLTLAGSKHDFYADLNLRARDTAISQWLAILYTQTH